MGTPPIVAADYRQFAAVVCLIGSLAEQVALNTNPESLGDNDDSLVIYGRLVVGSLLNARDSEGQFSLEAGELHFRCRVQELGGRRAFVTGPAGTKFIFMESYSWWDSADPKEVEGYEIPWHYEWLDFLTELPEILGFYKNAGSQGKLCGFQLEESKCGDEAEYVVYDEQGTPDWRCFKHDHDLTDDKTGLRLAYLPLFDAPGLQRP